MINPLSNDDADLETWKNATKGRVVIQRLSALGERRHEMIGGGKMFHLTPRERRVNQELAANRDLDVFLNGTLQPVRLVEEDADSQSLKGNPNHLAEDDIKSLFRAHHKTFEARLSEITNSSALEHLLAVAKEEDTRATVKQLERIRARLTEVDPSNVEYVTTHAEPDPRSTGMKAMTPR